MAETNAMHRVTIVRYGTRTTTRSDVYLNYPLYRQDDAAIDMDYFFWVIDGPSGRILVDSGYSVAAGAARGRTLLMDPAEALALAGVEPGSSPRIIVTHGHYDHIGNLNLFPDAELIMSRTEFDFWTGPHADKPLFGHSVEDRELAHLRTAADRGRITFIEGEFAVAPGLRIVEIGGHTPGQCVVFVDTSEGTVLLASDSVHYYEEYERDMVFTSVADLVEMYDSFAYIRELEASGAVAHVVSGHDPSTLGRFAAASGPLEGFAATIGALSAADTSATEGASV